VDFAAAGLLDGLDGPERAARLQLLERLVDDGVTVDELRAAIAEDRLALLPVERVLGGRYTAHEVAERSGVTADQLLRIRRALGFPDASADDVAWTEEDVVAAKSLRDFLDAGISVESIVEITRVLGEGMARLAPTITGAFADTYLKPGDTERDVALRYAAMARALLPSMTPVLATSLAAFVRDSARRGILSRAERERGQLASEEHTVVCFADLVGFTSLGGEVGVDELGGVARALAELAAEVASPPVRLVKTIGDAAMFVSPAEAPLVSVALALVEAVEAADLPKLRAGLASGPAVSRAGDWYGHSVNIASRVTGVARPGSVLCTQEVHDAARDEFDWSFAGKFRLKGVSGPQALHRARRLDGPAEPAPTLKQPREGRRRTRAPR
jgi:adenylate cyclase